jgi:co-chaperonin GroES (HSP10)
MEDKNYKPLGGNILLELIHDNEPTGIELLESSKKVSNKGKVLSIGDDVQEVSVDDIIIVKNRAGSTIGDNEDLIVVSEEEVLVIIEE